LICTHLFTYNETEIESDEEEEEEEKKQNKRKQRTYISRLKRIDFLRKEKR